MSTTEKRDFINHCSTFISLLIFALVAQIFLGMYIYQQLKLNIHEETVTKLEFSQQFIYQMRTAKDKEHIQAFLKGLQEHMRKRRFAATDEAEIQNICNVIEKHCPSVAPVGPTGFPGWKGDRGLPGFHGLPGPKGSTGIRGLPGRKGERGLEGRKGKTGMQGPLGLPKPSTVRSIPKEKGVSSGTSAITKISNIHNLFVFIIMTLILLVKIN